MTTFVCKICRTGFLTPFDLTKHEYDEHYKFWCKTCGQKFRSKSTTNKHQKKCQFETKAKRPLTFDEKIQLKNQKKLGSVLAEDTESDDGDSSYIVEALEESGDDDFEHQDKADQTCKADQDSVEDHRFAYETMIPADDVSSAVLKVTKFSGVNISRNSLARNTDEVKAQEEIEEELKTTLSVPRRGVSKLHDLQSKNSNIKKRKSMTTVLEDDVEEVFKKKVEFITMRGATIVPGVLVKIFDRRKSLLNTSKGSIQYGETQIEVKNIREKAPESSTDGLTPKGKTEKTSKTIMLSSEISKESLKVVKDQQKQKAAAEIVLEQSGEDEAEVPKNKATDFSGAPEDESVKTEESNLDEEESESRIIQDKHLVKNSYPSRCEALPKFQNDSNPNQS